ncbi:DNA gyrase inhibitor YacG [Pseudooctadecabacter jejudonensis]|uniref:DNA gyrase inhibitor YacG n=1 Tax=Pseudooctadecabacter jejudonensis TaxID=1391910 RepID=A0A1Y5SJI3_9RHOB|nr:DNA gyrase inhibitor YacG [Pseudooctadecabacter jejudonensis]SLN41890.1 zinc-binding protein [Pseudooctadecabacter jejudonensis]
MACPICDRKSADGYRPFCSKRCADVDLAKWMGGSYAIPSQNPDDFDELLDAMQKASEGADTDDEDGNSPPRLS